MVTAQMFNIGDTIIIGKFNDPFSGFKGIIISRKPNDYFEIATNTGIIFIYHETELILDRQSQLQSGYAPPPFASTNKNSNINFNTSQKLFFEGKTYTYDELKLIIEKAECYDR